MSQPVNHPSSHPMTNLMSARPLSDAHRDLLRRYGDSLLGVFGSPGLVLSHGDGAYVWDVDGHRYLDLLGGIAVSALGHGHPELVAALSKQAGEALHLSNFFTSEAQIEAAETLLRIAEAPAGSAVFFANSGTEAIEAAIKLSRRTGRSGIIAMEGAFHGRSTGALALTHKDAYRAPFEPLIPGVTHVPPGDVDALAQAVDGSTAAIILEPILGEAGVHPVAPDYLRAARAAADQVGALLIVDEIQTGMGRTGRWFAFQEAGVRPDAITLAKGLGGGVPVGALITLGERATGLLAQGQHGTTFGGNPLASRAVLAVVEVIERDGLLARASALGDSFARRIAGLGDPRILGTRGAGLLQAVALSDDLAPAVALAARDAGFIVNPVTPDSLRIAPPLVVTDEQLASFVAALPAILDAAESSFRPATTHPAGPDAHPTALGESVKES